MLLDSNNLLAPPDSIAGARADNPANSFAALQRLQNQRLTDQASRLPIQNLRLLLFLMSLPTSHNI
jgi:hypothetical protein